MIEAKLPDGTTLQFPDGTAGDVIDRVVRQHLGVEAPQPQSQPAPERSTWDAIVDNVVGRDDGVTSYGEGLATLLNMAGESATAGLGGDEFNAAVDSWVGRGNYDDQLQRYRGNEAQMREDHPVLSFGADLGGALAPGLGWAGATAKGANLLTRMAIGGGIGALGGAVNGFMEGEGPNVAQGFANRVDNMLPHGLDPREWGPTVTGAVAGAAVPALAEAAGGLYRAAGPGVSRALREAQDALGLNRAGAELVADAVERDAPYAGLNLAEAGPNAINAEMGPNSQSLLDFVVNRPGGPSSRAAASVENLAETRGQAFRSTLDDVLGDPMGVTSRTDALMESTRPARQAAYAGPYGFGLDYSDPSIQERLLPLLDRVDGSTLGRVQTTMTRDGARIPMQGFVNEAGEEVSRLTPDVEGWDYIARTLDNIRREGPILGEGAEGRIAAGNLAGDIRGTLDEIVPGFQDARALGHDVIANRNAIDFGSTLLRRDVPMDVAEASIRRMTPAELSFARQGVRDQIAEAMANVRRLRRQGGNMEAIQQAAGPVLDLLTEAGQRKITALLGPDEAGRLLQSAKETYSALVLRNSVARNSATAPRQAWEEAIDRHVPVTPSEALQEGRGLSGAVAAAVRPLAGDPAASRVARRDDIMEAIANILLAPAGSNGPTSILPALQQLPALLARTNGIAQNIGEGTQGLGSIVAALLAQQSARPQPLRITVDGSPPRY